MSNDVTINVFNKTGQDQTVVIFQQDPSLQEIFSQVFPTAWRVLPLGKSGGQAQVILPAQYQIGAGDTSDAFTGHVSNVEDTNLGIQWSYTTNGSYKELNQSGTESDSSVACVNNTGQYASISLVKNDLPLLTYPQVGAGSSATFLPTPSIYLAWYDNIQEGAQISASINEPQANKVDLTGASTVNATLNANPNTGALSWSVQVS